MAHQLANSAKSGQSGATVTYEEFQAWAGEEIRAEWIDGEVVAFELPKPLHQKIVLFLGSLLSQYAQSMNLGTVLIAPFEMRLLPVRSSREPDIAFVATDHEFRITVDRLDGPADLAVEVISPDSVTRDRRDKLLEYQRAGIPEYWIIDPRDGWQVVEPYTLTERGVFRLSLTDDRGRIHSTSVPGFWLDPSWFWQDPLPNPLGLLARIAPEATKGLLADEPRSTSDR
jgi:Uma2 family endonuclease